MPQPPWLRIHGSWFRRLDFLPPRGAWAIGIAGGALAGAALLGAAPVALSVIGFLALLGAATGLADVGRRQWWRRRIAAMQETGLSVRSFRRMGCPKGRFSSPA